MTQAKKFWESEETIQRIAAVLTNSGTQVFHRRLDSLKNLLRMWEENNDCRVLNNDDESDTHGSHTPQNPPPCPSEEIDCTHGRKKFPWLYAPSTTDTPKKLHSSDEPTSLSECFNLANVHLPSVKRRGRPKESRTLGRFDNSKAGH